MVARAGNRLCVRAARKPTARAPRWEADGTECVTRARRPALGAGVRATGCFSRLRRAPPRRRPMGPDSQAPRRLVAVCCSVFHTSLAAWVTEEARAEGLAGRRTESPSAMPILKHLHPHHALLLPPPPPPIPISTAADHRFPANLWRSGGSAGLRGRAASPSYTDGSTQRPGSPPWPEPRTHRTHDALPFRLPVSIGRSSPRIDPARATPQALGALAAAAPGCPVRPEVGLSTAPSGIPEELSMECISWKDVSCGSSAPGADAATCFCTACRGAHPPVTEPRTRPAPKLSTHCLFHGRVRPKTGPIDMALRDESGHGSQGPPPHRSSGVRTCSPSVLAKPRKAVCHPLPCGTECKTQLRQSYSVSDQTESHARHKGWGLLHNAVNGINAGGDVPTSVGPSRSPCGHECILPSSGRTALSAPLPSLFANQPSCMIPGTSRCTPATEGTSPELKRSGYRAPSRRHNAWLPDTGPWFPTAPSL